MAKPKSTKKKITKKKVNKKAAKKKVVKKVAKKAANKKTTTTQKVVAGTKQMEKLTGAYNNVAKELNTFIQSIERMSDCLEKFVNIAGPNLEGTMTSNFTETKTSAGTYNAKTAIIDDPFGNLTEANNSNGATTLTKEEVAQALQEVMTVAGQPKVKEILTAVKASRVSDIKEADYSKVVASCKEVTDAPANKDQNSQPESSATSIF